MENSLKRTETVCRACGERLAPDAEICARCNVTVGNATADKRATWEVLRYILVFAAVMLGFLWVIEARKIFAVAFFLQGVLPFLVFGALAFVVVKFWRR